VIVIDDHLAILAIGDRVPEELAGEPLATTYAFHYRLVRAVTVDATRGSLSRRLPEPVAVLDRVIRPPADRLVVLDPRASLRHAVVMANRHGANLIYAELLGAAAFHQAKVRLTRANVGRGWPDAMAAEGIDFAVVDG
jgi:hypothetical protein